MQKIKIGLDFHGVIDNNPMYFSDLTHALRGLAEIHIISGGASSELIPKLDNLNIYYDRIYSITNHMIALKEPSLTYNKDGTISVADSVWDEAKGIYCCGHGINIMIDDTEKYGKYMPNSTFFYHYKGE